MIGDDGIDHIAERKKIPVVYFKTRDGSTFKCRARDLDMWLNRGYIVVTKEEYHRLNRQWEDSHGHQWLVYLGPEPNKKMKQIAKRWGVTPGKAIELMIYQQLTPVELDES